MIYYLMILASTLMFSLQFFFNEAYVREEGESLKSAVAFSVLTSVVIGVLMLLFNLGKVEVTTFSLGIAGLTAVCCILLLVFSSMALTKVTLSLFSVYAMMGGMILPTVAGILFFHEPMTLRKGICILLIAAGILINTEFSKGSRKVSGSCLGVFLMNGMVGVLAKWHQSSFLPVVSSSGFMLLRSLWIIVLGFVILLAMSGKKPGPLLEDSPESAKKLFHLTRPVIKASLGYGVMEGAGNLLLLIALMHVAASVQYPMVTGGTMVFCAIIDVCRGIRLSKKTVVSCLLALAATVLIM